MVYLGKDIQKAIDNLLNKNQALIVGHYDGYIILAQNENDYKSKVSKIQRGDTFGFYTIPRAMGV